MFRRCYVETWIWGRIGIGGINYRRTIYQVPEVKKVSTKQKFVGVGVTVPGSFFSCS